MSKKNEAQKGHAPGTRTPGIHNPHSMDGLRRKHKSSINPNNPAGGAEEMGAYGLHVAPQTYDVHSPSKKKPDIKKVRRKKGEK